MNRLGLWLAAAFAVVVFAAPAASACLLADNTTSILYHDVPSDLPDAAIVLDVVFLDTVQPIAYQQPRLDRVRVRSVVRGDFHGDTVVVHLFMTSCTFDIRPGDQGFIIGEMGLLPDGRGVFEAMQESMADRRARGGRFE